MEKLNVEWGEGKTMDIVMYFEKGNNKYCCLGYQTQDNFQNAFKGLDINVNYRFAAALWEKSTCITFI